MNMLELAERCEEADGPSRSRDRAIALATGWKLLVVQKDEWFLSPNGGSPTSHPHYTASIDTALTLVPDGHDWLVRDDDGGAFANVSRRDATNLTEFHHPDFMPSEEELDRQGFAQGHRYARAATPALALCAAALKARAASVDTDRMAETRSGSGRSLGSAVPAEEQADAHNPLISKDQP